MRRAHALALAGLEAVVNADFAALQQDLYSEYEKLMCDSTSGVEQFELCLELGDRQIIIPEDF